MTCRICGNQENNRRYQVREMMLGTRHFFNYFQCSACECLQIEYLPESIHEYYPSDDYHSYVDPSHYFNNRLKNYVKGIRDSVVMNTQGGVRKIFSRVTKVDTLLPVVSNLSIGKNERVLDIGCGAGVLLYALKNAGYTHVRGIDPFITKNIDYPNGLSIYKESVFEHQGEYDVIMLHHAFEHMDQQLKVLLRIYEMLAVGGRLLIRIPLVSSYAWEKYGTDWVQLDAPRHFYLHSKKSMQLLAHSAGFRIENILYDSAAFQFWGSELYKRDIPLTDKLQNYFTQEQLAGYKQEAVELNKKGRGDQAAFFLVKR